MTRHSFDPVFKKESDGKWYFWDETWSQAYGPFPNEVMARQKLEEYFEEFLR